MLTIPFGEPAKGMLSAYETFSEIKKNDVPKGRRNVVPPSFIYDKKSRKPQISYIVATVLCLHKSKEVVLNQLTLRPSHQPALALKV